VPESSEPLNFEQSLTRLEEIARGLEDNKLGLNDSLVIYEEGVKLLRQCQGLLTQAERKIELLTGVDAAGQAITKPFDADATFSATEATSSDQRLTRRRKSPASKETTAKEAPATKETIVATKETITITTETSDVAPWEDLPVAQDGQAKNAETGRKSSTKSNSSAIDDLNRLF
jgi:exodeoxyribonuclease VII small subunit